MPSKLLIIIRFETHRKKQRAPVGAQNEALNKANLFDEKVKPPCTCKYIKPQAYMQLRHNQKIPCSLTITYQTLILRLSMESNERLPSNPHPEGLTLAQEFLATQLFEIGVVQFGNYRLKLHEDNPEAPLSPVYINLRALPLWPEVLKVVGDVYKQLAEYAQDYDACMGIPDAGVPLATVFALRTETPQIVMRKVEKTGHGIEGLFLTPKPEDVETVLLIDDLMTTAKSKVETINKLNEADFKVSDVVVLVDRDPTGKGKVKLAEIGVGFHAAFTMDQLLDYYARTGKITNEQHADAKTRLATLNKFIEKAS